MVRSSGFGSTTCYYFAHFRLAFATAPVLYTLTSQHIVTRRPVLQKVRGHTLHRCRCAPSACKHMVSGSLSLPSRGAFHLSLTVLYSIGHQVVFSLGRWVSRLPTEFLVLDGTPDPAMARLGFGYRAVTFFGCAFLRYSPTSTRPTSRSLPLTYFYMRFGLLPVRSPLLR